jgi:hypothetical protein
MNDNDPMGDCVPGRPERRLDAVDPQLTFVRAVNTSQSFYQRRFSSAIFTDDSVDFACMNLKVDAREHSITIKRLCQRYGFKEDLVHRPVLIVQLQC